LRVLGSRVKLLGLLSPTPMVGSIAKHFRHAWKPRWFHGPTLLLLAAWPGAIALAPGCRTTTDGIPNADEGIGADTACLVDAEAFCLKRTNCWPQGEQDFRFQRDWGTLSGCIETRRRVCLDDAQRKGTAQRLSRIEGCARALARQSCTDFLAGVALPTSACPPLGVGVVANGAPCVSSSQCMSSYCDRTALEVCGTCQDRLGLGRSCDQNADCAGALTCQLDMAAGISTCAQPQPAPVTAKVGDPCGMTGMPACDAGLVCVGMAMTRTCLAWATEGAACDAARRLATDCDPERNLACNRTTMVCQQRKFANTGEPCNVLPDGSFALCRASGRCVRLVDPATGQRPAVGTCIAPAGEGMPCFTAAADGPTCAAPLRCVLDGPGATTGRCLSNDYPGCGKAG
jgi:hypothetical protein